MPGHLSAEEIERFRTRAASPAQLVSLYSHLAGCEHCRTRTSDSVQPQRPFASLLSALNAEEPGHLIYEQVAACVDNRLDDVEREITASHLESCRECAERVEELRGFKSELAARDSAEPSMPDESSFWRRLILFWSLPARWAPLQLAATALIVVLCVWVSSLSLRARVAELTADRDRLAETSDALKAQASGIAEMRARIAELESKNEGLQRDYKEARASADDLRARLTKAQQIRSQTSGDYSRAQIALADGGRRVTLNSRGEITGLEPLRQPYEQAVKEALTAQRIDTPPEVAELVEQSGGLIRGTSPGLPFSLIAPVGTVVDNVRPTFRWHELGGATGYIVTVFDVNFDRVASSETLARTEWVVPEALGRGRTYSWQVTAIKDTERVKSPTTPAPEARFKVLESGRSEELENAKKTYHNSHLLLGILDTRAGLLDDAEREFELLAAANPKSGVARNLLRRIKGLRRN